MNRSFFGQMVPGGLIETPSAVTVPFGTLRIWNMGASFEWVTRNDWYGFNKAVAWAKRAGWQIIHVLAGEVETPPPSELEWSKFVTETVLRAAGAIRIWEPWNEPQYMGGRPPARIALRLAEIATDIIKSAEPNAIVLTPSLSAVTDFETRYTSEYLAQATRADALAIHGYCSKPDDLRAIAAFMRDRSSLPIYLTELSFATPAELARTFELGAELDFETVVWDGQNTGTAAYDITTPLGRAYVDIQQRLTSAERTGCAQRFMPWRR